MITYSSAADTANNVLAIAKFFENLDEVKALAVEMRDRAEVIEEKIAAFNEIESIEEARVGLETRAKHLDAVEAGINKKIAEADRLFKASQQEATNRITKVNKDLRERADGLQRQESEIHNRAIKLTADENAIAEVRIALLEEQKKIEKHAQELDGKLKKINKHLQQFETNTISP